MQDISIDDAICIFEKDNTGEVLQTWTYPSVDDTLKQVALNRSGLTSNKVNPYTFSRFKNTWIYIYTVSILNHKDKDPSYTPPDALKQVVAFSICVFRNNFNPEKYASLSQIMSNIYLKLGDPSKLLECQLRAWNKGQFDVGALGKFVDAEYDVRRSYLATSIKDIIKLFQEDIILVWNAMLTKKRVVVYSDKVSSLLKVIRALPLFVFHRQNWSILRPFVTIDDIELKDLSTTGVYCAGFVDSSIKSREDLYDILIDVNSKEVTIASHAKDQFILGSLHKDVLKTMIESAENEEINDQTLIKMLTQKIKDILTKLESLKVEVDGKSIITLESLQERKLPAGMDKFLYNVATAEGING